MLSAFPSRPVSSIIIIRNHPVSVDAGNRQETKRKQETAQPQAGQGFCETVQNWCEGTNGQLTNTSLPDCGVKVPGKEYQRIA
jgi:hypothetical protein